MLFGGTCAQQVPGRSRYLAGAAGQLAAESEVYKLKEIMASPTYRCTAIGYEHPAEPLVEHCAALRSALYVADHNMPATWRENWCLVSLEGVCGRTMVPPQAWRAAVQA